jgi:hypothetical protein
MGEPFCTAQLKGTASRGPGLSSRRAIEPNETPGLEGAGERKRDAVEDRLICRCRG